MPPDSYFICMEMEYAMNIIITAGGTRERIDSVRAITNDATGRLGSRIAEELSVRLANREHRIYYLCGWGSVLPAAKDPDLEVLRIEGTAQLQQVMEKLLTTQGIDAVIHSMAVSDYRVGSVTTLELAARAMFQRLKEGLNTASPEEWETAMREILQEQALEDHREGQNKISSELEHPLLLLEKTPKIISSIKGLSPATLLIGFKLLSGVGREQLIKTALGLLQRNQCDYVLANDRTEINGDRHIGYLVDRDGLYQTLESKTEIAKGIADVIFRDIPDKTR